MPLVSVRVVGDAVGIAAVAVEPLGGAGDVGERDAVLGVGVELGPVTDDQPLVRADRSRGRQHRHVEPAARRSRCSSASNPCRR